MSLDINCLDKDCDGECRFICFTNIMEDSKAMALIQCKECKNVYQRKCFTSDVRDMKAKQEC